MYKNNAEQTINRKARDIRAEANSIAEDKTNGIDRLTIAKLIVEDGQQLVALIEAEEARKAAAPANAVRLGKTQLSILDSLARHRSWSPGSGWIWTTRLQTENLLESLVARKLVDKNDVPSTRGRTYVRYTINDAGRTALEAAKAVAS